MILTRETLEQFVNGELPQAQADEVAVAVDADASLTIGLDNVKAHRALRQAALEAFQPDARESAAFAEACMAMVRSEASAPAPVAVIGPQRTSANFWMRGVRLAAACLVIGVGGFLLGRVSAKTGPGGGQALASVAPVAQASMPYVVRIEQPSGATKRMRFTDYKAAKRYVSRYVEDRTLASSEYRQTLPPTGQF